MTKKDFLKAKEDYVGLLMQGISNRLNLYMEGKFDYNFYYQFFKNYKPNMIKCYKKSNVLKVAKLHERIGDFKCIFFVDKDFDENEVITNVFITDYYNYESHIFSRENITIYLTNKHSLDQADIETLTNFLNSEAVLKMFHSEYERIKLYNGIRDNKLIEGNLTTIDIDENYNFDYTNLFTRRALPSLQTNLLNQVEMYNGKHIGNLVFGIFRRQWFESKFASDMKINNKDVLHHDLIIHCNLPKYINNAIQSI